MPVNKKQLVRLIKLVAELKENRYPNCHSFAEKLHRLEQDANMNIDCKAKTIQRDIRTLKEEFGAPISFDYRNNGFHLDHHGWDFVCPALQDEEMMASIFGAKIAEDIFPEPIKSKIRRAVDTQLAGTNPDALDKAFIKTLIAASGVNVKIDTAIFETVFNAWQERLALDIRYRAPNGTVSTRRIEPHVLTYYRSAWYIKGYCLKSDATRLFAIHRIKSAVLTDKTFEPDKKIIDSVNKGEVYDYGKVKDVEIWFAPESANYVGELKLRHGEKLLFSKDGSAVMKMAEAVPEEVIKLVMSECGNARLVKPAKLAEKIAEVAGKIAATHRSYRHRD